MLPLALDLARLNLVLSGTGEACLRRLRLLNEVGARALTVFSANPSPALAAADHGAVRRLTAAWIDRYGWRKQHHVAAPANDRGAEIKEPIEGGVS